MALIYEEYCLREEAGEIPDPVEYEARFPAIADRLREIIEIHGFVAECPSTAPHPPEPDAGSTFPESGQTIAGFRLVEELGRGSFARVFRAEELRLADRPVVLKVDPARHARAADPGAVAAYPHRPGPLLSHRSGDRAPSPLHAVLRPADPGAGPGRSGRGGRAIRGRARRRARPAPARRRQATIGGTERPGSADLPQGDRLVGGAAGRGLAARPRARRAAPRHQAVQRPRHRGRPAHAPGLQPGPSTRRT